MRVVSHVRTLVEELSWDEDRLARAIGVDPRTAQKLIEDGNWELRRETLHRLFVLGYDHGFDHGLFEVRQHAIWDTFRNAEVSVFRADLGWDTKAEDAIRTFLTRLECTPVLANASNSVNDLRDVVRSRNCIFIGSPKANRASEMVISQLDGGEPFDSSEENRNRFGLQFLGKSLRHKDNSNSALLGESTTCSILIRIPGRQHPVRVKVDWLSDAEFKGPAKEGQDAAAIVVCKRPLGTAADVTTILICGYTGLATYEAAKALIHGEPPISLEDLECSGSPITTVYTFRFHKLAYRRQRNLDELKEVVQKSGRWLPPW